MIAYDYASRRGSPSEDIAAYQASPSHFYRTGYRFTRYRLATGYFN